VARKFQHQPEKFCADRFNSLVNTLGTGHLNC
jgi:hypothetical protein